MLRFRFREASAPAFLLGVVLSTKELLSAPGFFEEPCFPCRLRVDELLQESRPRRVGVADFLAAQAQSKKKRRRKWIFF
jgi:hypothetical protein